MQLLSINVGQPRLLVHNGQPYSTAINKSPVRGTVEVGTLGVAGDKQADPENHGGPDQAVCCFCSEHFPFFAEQFGAAIEPGAFGENFTLAGALEDEVCIGDRFQSASGVVVQITQPRQPCYKLARKHNHKEIIPLVHQFGFSGFYLRVLSPGRVQAGDSFQLIARPNPQLSVRDTFWAKFAPDAPAELVRLLADAEGISTGWRNHFHGRMTNVKSASVISAKE